jgi:hypothetical protein
MSTFPLFVEALQIINVDSKATLLQLSCFLKGFLFANFNRADDAGLLIYYRSTILRKLLISLYFVKYDLKPSY